MLAWVLSWCSRYSGPADLVENTARPAFPSVDTFITLALLGALAMFTLPHHFIIGVVECRTMGICGLLAGFFPAVSS